MNRLLVVNIIIVILALFTTSCTAKVWRYKDSGDDFAKDLEGATPDFKQGWKDGCETGMSSGSNSFYSSMYKANKVDGYKIANSSDYKTAWNYAFWYCYRAEYIEAKQSIYGSFFGGYQ